MCPMAESLQSSKLGGKNSYFLDVLTLVNYYCSATGRSRTATAIGVVIMNTERVRLYLVKQISGGGYKIYSRQTRSEDLDKYLDVGWSLDENAAGCKAIDKVFADFKSKLGMINDLMEEHHEC